MSKPEFIDNRDGNTLSEALRSHLDWLGKTYKEPVELSVATGYFNPGGFAQIADHLGRISRVRLLLGAEPISPPAIQRRKPGEDPRGPDFERKILRTALQKEETGIRDDRNLLEFSSQTNATIRRLLDALASGQVEVRRYERGFLHGKAFVFSTDEGVIAGSSNFTAAGLLSNRELNLGHYQPGLVKQVKQWFEQLWEEAVPYDLAAIYAERFAEYDPYLVYLRVLWELYKDELEQERKPSGRIELTTFQTDGIDRAQRILEEYNGVLIADGVGLGKTFIAASLMQLVQENRQKVLLISPAALRDGTWKRFQDVHQLNFGNISFEELQRGSVPIPQDEIEMVVIDEAQAFRNPGAKRAQALRQLLQGKRPKKLVLLSATPVNNSLWDLYYLLCFFVKHDAEFADRGIHSLKERFDAAQKTNPFDLKPDMLFDVLDPVTVRRTRHFVKKWYPNEQVRAPGGERVLVRFPKPHVAKIDYDLEPVLPAGFFEEFEDALAPEDGHPDLTMARYRPSDYLVESVFDAGEQALVGLIRTGLLKRFESSAHAFGLTCEKLTVSHDLFLRALEKGFVPTPEHMEELADAESDEVLDQLLDAGGLQPVSLYKIEALRRDVTADRDLLRRYAEIGKSVKPEEDPKLRLLVEKLVEVLQAAEGDRNRRKVLIFSFYGDTVNWVYRFLSQILETDKRLAPYRGRLAAIVGDESLQGGGREKTVWGFAPESSEAPPNASEDRFDILVTTDVLAEGLNLQQCCNIINYDLPWNPMRLVQRHGRIDRIGSPHSDVYITCFFPDRVLDAMLRLEHRIRRKLAQAAASIGVESEVIPGSETLEIVFAETRAEIEAIRQGTSDLFDRGGEAEGAHSGEEYRQELRKGLEERRDEIERFPWGNGSGFADGPERGWMFCAKIGDRTFVKFVPATDESPIVSDTLGCLRRIYCQPNTPRNLPDEMIQGAYAAWAKAKQSIFSEWMKATDPANLQPRIRPFYRRAIDHLRRFPPPEIDQSQLELAIDSLNAPWGVRYERQLKQVLEDDSVDDIARSKNLIDKVAELGLTPSPPPEPLPLIDEEDVVLVCWMAVNASGAH